MQRTTKFVRYLPALGVHPTVITGPSQRETRWPPTDETLCDDLPSGLPVHRIGGELSFREPKGGAWWQRFLRRLTRRRTAFSKAWIDGCLELGMKVANKHVDLIYASISPFDTAEAASELSRRLAIPWVADLRDPWALDEMVIYSTRWHRWAELRRMRRALSSAAIVIMNTPEATRSLIDAFPEFRGRAVTITNGYDADDFQGDAPNRTDSVFRIVHTGGLHAGLGLLQRRGQWIRPLLGGARTRVHILSRSHYYLLKALEQWLLDDPSVLNDVELVLAGELRPVDRRLIEESPARGLVRIEGYVNHRRSIELLRSADLLFLPLHDLPPMERSRIVPGKTYEYLAARKPILAAVPEGDARDLVSESGMGYVCGPSDVEEMRAILVRARSSVRTGQHPPPAAEDFYRRFERRTLAEQLQRVLQRACGGAES